MISTSGHGALDITKEIEVNEHNPIETGGVPLKKVGLYVWDANNMQYVKAAGTSDGVILAGDMFPLPEYDEIDLGYSGTQVSTVVYKFGGNTVATLTLNYTGTVLNSVVKT